MRSAHQAPRTADAGTDFLPMSREDMRARGWDELDVLVVSGDAYVDHPSFGAAVIGRTLEAAGWRVGIVAQPDWTKPDDFARMGRPRLFAGVAAGAMDSMVANYTANRKLRRDDAYSPGGAAGRRPNNASVVYTNVLRSLFKGLPVVLGGIEASLRRFAHYDYWKDAVRRSILLDAKADLIVAGMGELQVLEIAKRLDQWQRAGANPDKLKAALERIAGTVESLAAARAAELDLSDALILPDAEVVGESKAEFMRAALEFEAKVACRFRPERDRDAPPAPSVAQRSGDRWIVEWEPRTMSTRELDAVYAAPYQRRAHPSYREKIPALEPVQFSVTTHRGCFGGCSFCALSAHQGRRVVSRSAESVLREIEGLTRHPDFRGTISDVGGPTANMYGMGGRDEGLCAACKRVSCLFPGVCPNLDSSHEAHRGLLERILRIPGVKHVFIASGIRYDLLMDARGAMSPDKAQWFRLLVTRLVGGHLSVAPEHASEPVLRLMRKPPFECFLRFKEAFERESVRAGKEQYLIPYFIASFPGSTDANMREVENWLRGERRRLQQIQDFLPAPMTLAGAMYHTGLGPEKGPDGAYLSLQVAKGGMARQRQRGSLTGEKPKPPRENPKGGKR